MTVPFQKFRSNKFILAFFLIAAYLLILLTLAGDLFGKRVEPIDLQFAYTPERAYQLIDSYTPQTRKFYILCEITIDIAYPIAYTLFLSFSMLTLYPRREQLALLPYVIFIFDLCENMGIIILLSFYPARLNTVAWITSAFTTMKWLVCMVCFGFLLVGLIKKWSRKPDPQKT